MSDIKKNLNLLCLRKEIKSHTHAHTQTHPTHTPNKDNTQNKTSLEKEMAPTSVFLLGKPYDRGAWRVTVQGVTKSQTQLSTHSLTLSTKTTRYCSLDISFVK